MTQPAVRSTLVFLTLALLLTGAPAAVHAQRSLELGTDAHLFFRRVTFEGSDETESATQFQLPTGLRLGFFLAPRTSIEARLELNYINPSESDDFTSFALTVGPMIHLSVDQTRTQGYVRPFLGLNYVHSVQSESQLTFGGALGLKVPMTTHAAMRYEVTLLHGERKSPFPGETQFGIAAGFSLFLP